MMKNEPSCWPEAVLMRAEPAREDEYPAYIIIKQPTAYPLPALTPNATDRFRNVLRPDHPGLLLFLLCTFNWRPTRCSTPSTRTTFLFQMRISSRMTDDVQDDLVKGEISIKTCRAGRPIFCQMMERL
jgi:hypothetical protein